MDNLIKAMECFINEYYVDINLVDEAIAKITSLQKSNRNWRRKAQRLRKEIKELKEKENV